MKEKCMKTTFFNNWLDTEFFHWWRWPDNIPHPWPHSREVPCTGSEQCSFLPHLHTDMIMWCISDRFLPMPSNAKDPAATWDIPTVEAAKMRAVPPATTGKNTASENYQVTVRAETCTDLRDNCSYTERMRFFCSLLNKSCHQDPGSGADPLVLQVQCSSYNSQ